MSTVWKVLLGLVLALPLAALATGALLAASADNPTPRETIVIQDGPSPSDDGRDGPKQGDGQERPGQQQSTGPDDEGDDHGGDGGGDDGGDDEVEEVRPEPDTVEEDNSGPGSSSGGDDGDGGSGDDGDDGGSGDDGDRDTDRDRDTDDRGGDDD